MDNHSDSKEVENIREEVVNALEPLVRKYFSPSDLLALSFRSKISRSKEVKSLLSIQLIVITMWKAIQQGQEEELLPLIGLFALKNIEEKNMDDSLLQDLFRKG